MNSNIKWSGNKATPFYSKRQFLLYHVESNLTTISSKPLESNHFQPRVCRQVSPILKNLVKLNRESNSKPENKDETVKLIPVCLMLAQNATRPTKYMSCCLKIAGSVVYGYSRVAMAQ